MKHKFIVYLFTNKETEMKYVGFTGDTLENRVKQHMDKARLSVGKRSTRFHKVLSKYGIDGFTVETLFVSECREASLYMENYYIKLHHTFVDDPECNGYNLTQGGQQAKKSKESIEKQRAKVIGVKKPDGFGEKVSARVSGENNPMFGKTGELHPNYGTTAPEEKLNKMSESATLAHQKRKLKLESGEIQEYKKPNSEESLQQMRETKRQQAANGELWLQNPENAKIWAEKRKSLGLRQTEKQKSAAKMANVGVFDIEDDSGIIHNVIGLGDFCAKNDINYTNIMYAFRSGKGKFVNGFRIIKNHGKINATK